MLDTAARQRGGQSKIARFGAAQVAAHAREGQQEKLLAEARIRLGDGATAAQVLTLAKAIARARRVEAGIRGVLRRQQASPSHPIVERTDDIAVGTENPTGSPSMGFSPTSPPLPGGRSTANGTSSTRSPV